MEGEKEAEEDEEEKPTETHGGGGGGGGSFGGYLAARVSHNFASRQGRRRRGAFE